MSAPLILHELPPSPNSVKVRLGLGFKGLDYERRPVSFEQFPGERSALVALSGQPRTPVLEHGAVRIFDSNGILRYLEANFPDTPKLFRADWAAHGEIEQWELYGRTELGATVGALFAQAMAPEPDAEAISAGNASFNAVLERVERTLTERAFLIDEAPSAADIALAPFVQLGCLPEDAGEPQSIQRFFATHLALDAARTRTRAWAERLMAYDSATQPV